MLSKISIVFICLVAVFTPVGDSFDRGMVHYNIRHEGHKGYGADPERITQALHKFLESYAENPTAKTAEYVLRSYYFKGNFSMPDETAQLKFFEEGKNFGIKAIEKFPNSAEVLYYHAITYGKWGEDIGLWTGLKDNAADKLKSYFEKVIELDPKAIDAGGHRILGLIHYQIPYVPFIISWPSSEDAEYNLKKALEYFPENPSNNFMYAEFLEREGREEEAVPFLKKVMAMEPRQTFVVEDTWAKIKSQELLDKIND
ncbi:MAG: tetratricopeptide repeat protein [Flavobacteriales bacterium]|nr:tetratricopeptide repeat protein [Flavobacteriales bacterium]